MYAGQRRGVRHGQVGAGATSFCLQQAGDADRKSHRASGENLHELAATQKMPDIIDIDSGVLFRDSRPSSNGEEILHRVIQFASGESKTKAELLAQNDLFHGRERSL